MTDDEYDAYVRRAHRGLCRRARALGAVEPDDAQSVVNQVLTELYAHAEDISTEDEADRFVRWRLKRRVIDLWRHDRSRKESELLTDSFTEWELASIPSPESHPDEWTEFEVSNKSALDLFNSLDEKDRTLLRLRVLGLTPAECAALLGIGTGAERTRWCRLKKRLANEAVAAAASEKEATA
ncbi:sigma-70 family RNA polymerase sigma factor [Streptomyces sp. NPDC004533]|uniref:RNA polymerase sigma factor n=1 Tax=Streptomyces sp. NPDC004533 TaxID=3154278 RepID=UPI0033B521EF